MDSFSIRLRLVFGRWRHSNTGGNGSSLFIIVGATVHSFRFCLKMCAVRFAFVSLSFVFVSRTYSFRFPRRKRTHCVRSLAPTMINRELPSLGCWNDVTYRTQDENESKTNPLCSQPNCWSSTSTVKSDWTTFQRKPSGWKLEMRYTLFDRSKPLIFIDTLNFMKL